MGQITLGHAGFMSVGAYTAALFTKSGVIPGFPGYIVGILLGGMVAGVVGIIIGIPALRLKGDYLAIITLAFGEIIRVLIEYFDFKVAVLPYKLLKAFQHLLQLPQDTIVSAPDRPPVAVRTGPIRDPVRVPTGRGCREAYTGGSGKNSS